MPAPVEELLTDPEQRRAGVQARDDGREAWLAAWYEELVTVDEEQPVELVTVMKHEMKRVKENHGIEEDIKWHLWSLDKSQRVCTVKVTLPHNQKTE